MIPLPIDFVLQEIVDRLRASRSLVLVAPPGAGKTTRVPPAILRAGLVGGEHPNIVMLQPRRVAARASAHRIAEENGWELGREVGYHVRFDRKVSDDTRLRVLTEGILTRQLLDDPFLPGVGAVLLDEFHERSLHTDVTIALLREVQETVRPDLRIVVMSATLDAAPVAEFLGGAPIVRSEGRAFPVEVTHVGLFGGRPQERLAERVGDAIADVLAAGDAGDVLVFLPGAEEIRRVGRRIEAAAARHDALVLPLHGSLPAEEQTRALRPARQQKVILSTNVAETSLTIDGVRTVIDSGLARVAGYDPRRGLDRLELKRISRASATQRAGRAGRTAPGRCVRLWSAAEDRALADFELPEVRRVDLASTVLSLHAWGRTDAREFGWYEAPGDQAISAAERLLEMLGALTLGKITPLGRQMLALPAHPRLARLLIDAARHGMLREGATIAALLSEKDVLRPPDPTGGPRHRTIQGPSDVTIRLDALDRAERERFAAHLRDSGIDPIAARQVAKARDDLMRVGRRLPSSGRNDDLLKLPLLAYPDRVCRRRGDGERARDGGRRGREARARIGGDAGGILPGARRPARRAKRDAGGDRTRRQRSARRVAGGAVPAGNPPPARGGVRRGADRVVGRIAVYYRDLLLHEDRNAAIDPAKAAAALAAAARPMAGDIFRNDEAAATLLARVALLRDKMPEHPWPRFDDDELGELLGEAAAGKRSLEELRRAALAPLLMSRLHWPLDRLLEEHAPEAIEVPTGNRIRVAYSAGQAPVLAVRLQELFGWTDTPRIAAGRTAVLLHLLGPNYRPVQITDDLRSFWGTTYFQVRKDLRVRYPKHSWPEDPLTAKAVAKGRSHK